MQGKSIHIVFEVINFLLSDEAKKHKLFPIDKLILITLASHKGTKGIFPMQETLADELGIGRRYLRLRIRFLEKSGFLFVEKIGRRHFYHLLNLSTTGEPQIPYHQKIEEPQFRSQGNYSSAHRGTTDATNNKVSNKLNKSERSTRKKTALPLSVDFEPNRETVQEAKRVGLTYDEANYEVEKFFNYYLENGEEKTDWQLVLQNWFIRAGDYKRKNGAITVNAQEVRSTVPWFYPEQEAARKSASVSSFMDQVKERLSTQGGKPNGLGRTEKGEVPKN